MKFTKLKKRAEFVNVSKKGDFVATYGFILQYIENDLGIIRVGYTATKRLGGAVVRNRIKRRFRAIIQEFSAKIEVKTGYDLVLIGRTSGIERDFLVLKKDLSYAFKKASILKSEK